MLLDSDEVMIRCEGVSKTYRVWTNLLRGKAHDLFQRNKPNPYVRHIHALKDINLEIKRGEVFGFLGLNGAGKSTLLACIAGISPIDTGKIESKGGVEAILKIGVGFHPRLTGRENILIGMIALGASPQQAKEAVEAVLDFAELRSFGDMPFYTYSSGMMARLQFAVAVHRTPEILIVDEALSTGDGYFASKATRRIEDICRSGSTVIFVTHSVSFVESLCHRAAILDGGTIAEMGDARSIGASYRARLSFSMANEFQARQPEIGGAASADLGSGEVSIVEASVERAPGQAVAGWRRPLTLVVDLDAHVRVVNPRFRVDVYCAHHGVLATSFGNTAIDPDTLERRLVSLPALEGRCRVKFHIPELPLAGSTYYWSFALLPEHPRRKLEGDADHLVYRRIMGYFQVESFPDNPETYGRTVITETPVEVSLCDVEGAPS